MNGYGGEDMFNQNKPSSSGKKFGLPTISVFPYTVNNVLEVPGLALPRAHWNTQKDEEKRTTLKKSSRVKHPNTRIRGI